MTDVILQALFMYGLAIVVSMLTAVMIRGIVFALAAAGRRGRPPAQAQVAPPPVSVGPPAHHVAAIAAAIAAMGGRHRVVRIAPARGGGAWISEGRVQQQTSHKPR